MTMVWMMSWDQWLGQAYFNAAINASSGGGMVAATGRHGGVGSLATGVSGTTWSLAGMPTSTTYVVGHSFRLYSGSIDHATAHHTITFKLGATEQFTVRLVEVSTNSEEFRIEVRNGGETGSVIATMIQALHQGRWYFLEFKVLANSTTGTYEVKLDGVQIAELTDTGVDTTGAGSPNIDGVRFWSHPRVIVDDHYILNILGGVNDDFMGQMYIEGLVPDGAGNQTDWTPVSAANWANVDDPGSGSLAADHNQTSLATDVDLYTFTNLVRIKGASVNIPAVHCFPIMRLASAGSEDFHITFRSGGVEHDGTTRSVVTTTHRAIEYSEVFPTNLAESVAWNVADINAIEFGVEAE